MLDRACNGNGVEQEACKGGQEGGAGCTVRAGEGQSAEQRRGSVSQVQQSSTPLKLCSDRSRNSALKMAATGAAPPRPSGLAGLPHGGHEVRGAQLLPGNEKHVLVVRRNLVLRVRRESSVHAPADRLQAGARGTVRPGRLGRCRAAGRGGTGREAAAGGARRRQGVRGGVEREAPPPRAAGAGVACPCRSQQTHTASQPAAHREPKQAGEIVVDFQRNNLGAAHPAQVSAGGKHLPLRACTPITREGRGGGVGSGRDEAPAGAQGRRVQRHRRAGRMLATRGPSGCYQALANH